MIANNQCLYHNLCMDSLTSEGEEQGKNNHDTRKIKCMIFLKRVLFSGIVGYER